MALFSCTFPNEVLSPGSSGEDDTPIPGGVTMLSFWPLTTTPINEQSVFCLENEWGRLSSVHFIKT